MISIKLTKVPYFKERLIDIQGRTVSNINLEGSFALNLKSNEAFISYNKKEDAWFLNIPETDLTTINNSISTINGNITIINNNITNIQNGLDSNWIYFAVSSLDLKAYDANDNWLQDLTPAIIGNDPNLNYFKNQPVYFKYKVIGSTVIIQYLFGIDMPDITDEPSAYFSIKLNLSAINSAIFNPYYVWADSYFSTVVLPAVKKPADHLQMCYYKSGKLVFTCNNFINGHHGEPVAFNYDFGANSYYYGPFKMIFAGTHIFEKGSAIIGGSDTGTGAGDGGTEDSSYGGGDSVGPVGQE